MPVSAILALALGTYLFRVSGPLLASRFDLSPRVQRVTTRATTVLLAALVATAALCPNGHFDSCARPSAVALAAILAWRKVPFVVVVIAAAAAAAGMRALGLP